MDVKVRHTQVAQQNAAVCVGIGAHPAVALWRQFGQFRHESSILIKQFFGLVAFHPAFKLLNMIRMLCIHQDRHLVRSERALDLQAVDDFRPVQPLGDRRTIIGQRGRVASFLSRALFWIFRISSMAVSKVVAISSCIFSGSSPSTK